MTRLGVVLATEDHPASRLLQVARSAQAWGFDHLFVSDHFHPWNPNQGCSSHSWSLLGALAVQTEKVKLVSAVTCPGRRQHISTLAQAAATVAALSCGRLLLGLGTGERLNEAVTGEAPQSYRERRARLVEAVECLRLLWSGREVDFEGRHHRLRRARLYSDVGQIPLAVAASGPKSAQLAGELGGDLITLALDAEVLEPYRRARRAAQGEGSAWTQVSVCWAPSREEAVATAHRLWPEVALPGTVFTQLETPTDFGKAGLVVTPEEVDAAIVCGPDPEPYRELYRSARSLGYRGVAFHQIGPHQERFQEFLMSVLEGGRV